MFVLNAHCFVELLSIYIVTNLSTTMLTFCAYDAVYKHLSDLRCLPSLLLSAAAASKLHHHLPLDCHAYIHGG
jgi:hypothetical protein